MRTNKNLLTERRGLSVEGWSRLAPTYHHIHRGNAILSLSALRSTLGIGIAAIFFALLFTINPAHAISVKPAIVDFVAQPGETKNVQFEMGNDGLEPAMYSIELQNFTASGHDGEPQLLPADATTGFAAWGNFQHAVFPVPPGKFQKIGVSISVPKDAPAGGVYGTIFVKETKFLSGNSGPTVESRIGVLVFGTIGSVPSVPPSVETFTMDRETMLTPPKSFSITLLNEQKSHVTPSGALVLVNQFGKTVASIPLNNGEARMLPGTHRTYVIAWTDAGMSDELGMAQLKPGYYRAIMKLTTGAGPLVARATIGFFVLPNSYVYGIVAVILLLVFALFRSRKKQPK